MSFINRYVCFILFCLTFPYGLQAQYTNHFNKVIFNGGNETSFQDFINGTSGILTIEGNLNLLNNLTNKGKILYSNNTGRTSFIGINIQEVNGSGISLFNEFLIDNPGLNLDQDIEVRQLTFISGIILADKDYSGIVKVIDDGEGTGMSDQSFVDGKVEKLGNDEFLFPIGDESFYRKASISAPSNTTDVFSAQYFYESPGAKSYNTGLHDAYVSKIDDSEYWEIERLEGNSMPTVTLSWDVSTTTPYDFIPQDISKMRIVRWNGTRWITEKFLEYTGNSDSGTITSSVSDYGIFTLAVYDIGDEDLFISDGFSPNGDGINDLFVIKGLDKYLNARLEVYNRWGDLVYEKDSYGNTSRWGTTDAWWDGYSINAIGNKPLPAATYIYFLKLGDHKSKVLSGTIFINR